MKTLGDKITSKFKEKANSIKKGIIKYAVLPLALSGALSYNSAQAQTDLTNIPQGINVTQAAEPRINTYNVTPEEYQTIQDNLANPNTFPALTQSYDVFNSPYNHVSISGKDSLDFYGSGDVNLDGNVNLDDAQQVYIGVKNNRADVNGDGQVTSADGELIEKKANEQTPMLPAYAYTDLENSTPEAKRYWMNQLKNNVDKSDEHAYNPSSYVCTHFSWQWEISGRGVENLDKWSEASKFEVPNATYNIPILGMSTKANTAGSNLQTENLGHAINTIYTGPNNLDMLNTLRFENYLSFEPQNDSEVVPGDWSMNKDEYARPTFLLVDENGQDYDYPIMDFNLEAGTGIPERSYKTLLTNPKLIKTNFSTDKISGEPIDYQDYVLNPKTGEYEVSSNLDLKTKIEFNATDSKVQNLIDKYVIEYEKEPLYPDKPETYDVYFKQKKKTLVQLIQDSEDRFGSKRYGLFQQKEKDFELIVDDLVAPTGQYVSDYVKIKKGDFENIEDAIELTNVQDNNPNFPVTKYLIEAPQMIEETGIYRLYELKYGLEDEVGKTTDLGKAYVEEAKPSGINEAKAQGGFDIEARYSQDGSVNLMGFSSKPGEVEIDIFNIVGQEIREIKYEVMPGNEKNNFVGNMVPGTYIYRGTLKTKDGNISTDTGKFQIRK